MLHICIIDDEHLALHYLDFLLNKIEGVQVSGKYNDSNDLIHHVQTQNVDAVFMDIHMPDIKGIDLAEQLLNIQPSLHVVFVTAYNEYAVKAFELNALDYLLKPVHKERLQQTIQRIGKKDNKKSTREVSQSTYLINNLGDLSIYKDGAAMDVKWRTLKAKELFAYLIQKYRNPIRKSDLTDLMWGNLPWEKAHSQLYSTIYQIRKVIQQTGLPIKIISQDEFYHFNMENVLIQSDEWERSGLQLLEKENVSTDQYFDLLEIYKSHYLEQMNYDWVLEERDNLRDLWLQIIEAMAIDIRDQEEGSAYLHSKLKTFAKLDEKAVKLVRDILN